MRQATGWSSAGSSAPSDGWDGPPVHGHSPSSLRTKVTSYSLPRSHGPTVPQSGRDGRATARRGAFILMWPSHGLCPAAGGRKLPHLSSVHVATGASSSPPPTKGPVWAFKGPARNLTLLRWSPRPCKPEGQEGCPPLWANAAEPAALCSHPLAFSHHGHGPGVTVTLRPPCPPLELVYTVQQFTFHKTVSPA